MPAFGQGNLVGAYHSSGKIRQFSNFSSTVLASFVFDGTNVSNASTVDNTPNTYTRRDQTNAKHLRLSGFSATIKTSWADTSSANGGITIDKNNQYYDVPTNTTIHYHSGFTATVTSSITDSTTGLKFWDIGFDSSNNLFTVDFGNNIERKYTGFSSTLSNTFALQAHSPRGTTSNNGTDTIVSYVATDNFKYIKYSAFTSTIKTSFGAADGTNAPHGCEWDKFTDRFPAVAAVVTGYPPTLLFMNIG